MQILKYLKQLFFPLSKPKSYSTLGCVQFASTHQLFSEYIQRAPKGTHVFGAISINNLSALSSKFDLKSIAPIITKFMLIFENHFSSSCISWLSPNELVFCFPQPKDKDLLEKFGDFEIELSQKFVKELEKPIFIDYSVGITEFGEKSDLEQSIMEVFLALNLCRNNKGKNILSHTNLENSFQVIDNQTKLASFFQKSILDNRLRLAYQPIIDSKSGKVIHHECLLRIVTEEGKIISAGPFIHVAEACGFIDQIDFLVLDLVVQELKHNHIISLAMNISSATIDNQNWILTAKTLLKDPSLSSRLIIEITETSMYKDLAKVAQFVDTMQSLGCQVAIDDFGAGYTSFTQLKTINADIIKIDGIFIRDIVDNFDSRLFVKTLLEFAHSFGIKTVAEFVETGEIAKVLMELNIDYMQGNYFSPAVNFRSWVNEEEALPVN